MPIFSHLLTFCSPKLLVSCGGSSSTMLLRIEPMLHRRGSQIKV
jgi:hypothetical protein